MPTIDPLPDSSRENEVEPKFTADLNGEEVLKRVPKHHKQALAEVLSVCIADFTGDLYGTIKIWDVGAGTQYLYDRKKEEYQSIDPDNDALLLTGPAAQAILACDNFTIDVNLMDKDSDLPVFIGRMEWNRYRRHINVYEEPTCKDVLRFQGDASVTVYFMVFTDAVMATVKVTLIFGDGEEERPAHVYGKITAYNSNISEEDLEDEVSVLFQKAPNESIDVMSGKLIPLSRSIVAVPFMSSLIVRADLQDSDSNVIAKGTAHFPAKLSGTFEKRIEKRCYGQSCVIRVKVTFESHI